MSGETEVTLGKGWTVGRQSGRVDPKKISYFGLTVFRTQCISPKREQGDLTGFELS